MPCGQNRVDSRCEQILYLALVRGIGHTLLEIPIFTRLKGIESAAYACFQQAPYCSCCRGPPPWTGGGRGNRVRHYSLSRPGTEYTGITRAWRIWM